MTSIATNRYRNHLLQLTAPAAVVVVSTYLSNTSFSSYKDPLKTFLVDDILKRWIWKISVINFNVCHLGYCYVIKRVCRVAVVVVDSKPNNTGDVMKGMVADLTADVQHNVPVRVACCLGLRII